MGKIFYEIADKINGSTQTAGHKARKVSAPKSRKRGRGPVALQGL